VLIIMPRQGSATEPVKDVPIDGDPGSNADVTLLLEVQINGHSTGKVGEFTMHRGKLVARPAELRDLGFRVSDSLALGPNGLIALSDMPGLTWSLDLKKLELNVTASDNRLLPTVLQPVARQLASDHRVIESGTGLTLNYDAVGSFAGGAAGGTGSADLRAFSPWGIVSSGWLAYAGATSSGSGTNTAIRLDSAYTFADVNSLRRYSLGDFINGGLAWTRPVHLEGAQIRSDFSMRPDLVTFPLPTISGSTAVPSSVNVLADGNLVASSEVGAGPFEVPQLPVISGAGTISMTVTNALGQQVTLTQPFYASSSLLDPGLQTFAVQTGLVRRNWGTISDDYGKIAGTVVYRRGLTRKFTIEGSAEGTPGTTLAGAGGVAQIGNLGVLNFSASASGGSGHTGAQFSIGAQRIGRVFSIGGSATIANRDYRDVASMNGDGVQRKLLSAFTSLYFRRYGSLGAAYGGVDQDATPTPIKLGVVSAEHSHVASGNYSRQFHHMSIYASGFKDFASSSGSSGLQVGLTIPLGRRSSANVSATSDGNVQLQAQRSAALIGEWGYDAYVSAGNSHHEFGQVQYKSPVGLFTAGVDQSSGQTTLRVESQGALSFVDGGLFPSNEIYDSFAIVDTSPMPHVHVYQENRDVGRTDSAGRLLVPDMRSFDLNHINIEPTDIPPDVTINTASREMRPQDRSGVVIKFPINVSHSALLHLVDETGVPMSIGATATLRSSGATVPVGYDGEAYLEDLSTHNELTVERVDGRLCTVAFDYHPISGGIPSIGPLSCKEATP
jgi:outer membrane usher protein